MKDYQKVVLYVYPRVEKILRDFDGMICALAFTFGESGGRCAERIAEYIGAKQNFMYLREIVDEITANLSREERYLLEYKYFRRKRMLEGEFCGYALDCNERTYFRRQARLAEKLNALFLQKGLNEQWFNECFGWVRFMQTSRENVRLRGDADWTDKRRVKSLICTNSRARKGA